MLGLESREAEQQLIEEQKKGENLGYVLGWFCGGMLVFGVIVAAFTFRQGSRRKAIQAVLLPIMVLAGIAAWFLLLSGISQLFSMGREWDDVVILLLLAGLFFLPIVGLRFLRSLQWPAYGGRSH
jgi:arginine exporter protein ArgO